jgi:O-acetyl-ADP-ribose deacetylase (regulator of RNase III)
MSVTVQLISQGNLFHSRTQTWVNAVNCVGVMGKGIALDFKNRFPEMFQDYAARCQRREVRLGTPFLYKSVSHPWILNFPTKHHWRDRASLEAIAEGLEHLARHYGAWGIKSLAFPALGCGLGQLNWAEVGPFMDRTLRLLKLPVELYAPRQPVCERRYSHDIERD